MSDSFIVIFVVIVAGVLIFVTPMITISHRNDVLAAQEVQAAIIEFVDGIRHKGIITKLEYENLEQRIYATRRNL